MLFRSARNMVFLVNFQIFCSFLSSFRWSPMTSLPFVPMRSAVSDVMRTASQTAASASRSPLVAAARCGLGSILRANSPAWCAGNLLLLPSSHCIRSRLSRGCVQLLDSHWPGLGPQQGMRCCDPRIEQPWCLKREERVECQKKTLQGRSSEERRCVE